LLLCLLRSSRPLDATKYKSGSSIQRDIRVRQITLDCRIRVMSTNLLLLFFAGMAFPNAMSKVVWEGHDVVQYHFIDSTAPGELGSSDFTSILTSDYGSFEFHFKNSDNKALFDAEPTKYAPKYGGY